ncbi:unnamed protein product [Adineta ricciae]|uniref:Uncharacterized protein n=1 Tax=Adineta ricciae TaxID=249248 RepID=A0A815TVE6_ADIRI|nr:unnamed protein product [Adineta ricciae]
MKVDFEYCQSIDSFNQLEFTSKKIERLRGGGGGYATRFALISGTLGFICLIPAIILTLTGAAKLNDSDNGRLVAGIILFALSITLIVLAFLTCCLK